MEVKKIIAKIRYKQKDIDEVKFSDYDILQSLNECIEYLNKSYGLQNADFLEKARTYELTSDEMREGIRLPSDFLTLIGILRTEDNYKLKVVSMSEDMQDADYRISGGRLYSGSSAIKLLYKAIIEEVENVTDDIEIPDVFFNSIVNITMMIMNNANTDVLTQAINDATESIIPRRRYSNVNIKMPFIV